MKPLPQPSPSQLQRRDRSGPVQPLGPKPERRQTRGPSFSRTRRERRPPRPGTPPGASIHHEETRTVDHHCVTTKKGNKTPCVSKSNVCVESFVKTISSSSYQNSNCQSAKTKTTEVKVDLPSRGTITHNDQKLVNLSSKTLTETETSLLSKGLKFCSTQNRTDPGEACKDLDSFHNNLRIKEFFHKDSKTNKKCANTNHSNTENDGSRYGNSINLMKLRKRSTWWAPTGSANLEMYININEMDLGKCRYSVNNKQNLTTKEKQSLKNLAKDRSIIIKPADKGGAIVIHTLAYLKEANRQLSDERTYTKLDRDPTKEFQSKIDEKLKEHVDNGEYNEKVRRVLSNKDLKTPNIHFLPKIHKNQTPPPGRPIVSANN